MPNDTETHNALFKLARALLKAETQLREDGHRDAADAAKRARRELALFAEPRAHSDGLPL